MTNKSKDETPERNPSKDAPNLQKSPTGKPRRRPSEGGVGQRYSQGSDTFSNPESSPTSKTP
jgi:hypothetical protein